MFGMLLYPFKYLCIKWETKDGKTNEKLWIDIFLPVIGATAVFLILYFLNADKFPSFFKTSGFDVVISFLQTLPGFYLAALAVIASFNNDFLDDLTYGEGPIDSNNEEMSRRRFLTNCIAYLAILSMVLVGISSVIKYVDSINILLSLDSYKILVSFATAGYVFLLLQLFFITLLVLYYLGDRLHRAK